MAYRVYGVLKAEPEHNVRGIEFLAYLDKLVDVRNLAHIWIEDFFNDRVYCIDSKNRCVAEWKWTMKGASMVRYNTYRYNVNQHLEEINAAQV